jgi:hypothetical protein
VRRSEMLASAAVQARPDHKPQFEDGPGLGCYQARLCAPLPPFHVGFPNDSFYFLICLASLFAREIIVLCMTQIDVVGLFEVEFGCRKRRQPSTMSKGIQ